jgi:hypothetical protein
MVSPQIQNEQLRNDKAGGTYSYHSALRDLFNVLYGICLGRAEENYKKTSICIACLMTKIWTRDLPNTKQDRYLLGSYFHNLIQEIQTNVY